MKKMNWIADFAFILKAADFNIHSVISLKGRYAKRHILRKFKISKHYTLGLCLVVLRIGRFKHYYVKVYY